MWVNRAASLASGGLFSHDLRLRWRPHKIHFAALVQVAFWPIGFWFSFVFGVSLDRTPPNNCQSIHEHSSRLVEIYSSQCYIWYLRVDLKQWNSVCFGITLQDPCCINFVAVSSLEPNMGVATINKLKNVKTTTCDFVLSLVVCMSGFRIVT